MFVFIVFRVFLLRVYGFEDTKNAIKAMEFIIKITFRKGIFGI